jgi:hypothetical protein
LETKRFKKEDTNNNNSKATWEYTICPFSSYLNGAKSVCKIAFMAVMDIREHIVESAQRKIRSGIRNEALIDKDVGESTDRKANLSLEECLNYFEIDHQNYSHHLKCFVSFAHVPDTVTGLLATAFLVDFFQICGEQEVL